MEERADAPCRGSWSRSADPRMAGGWDASPPEAKEKLQPDGRRGTLIIRLNPIPDKWAVHKVRNNNIKEVLPLL